MKPSDLLLVPSFDHELGSGDQSCTCIPHFWQNQTITAELLQDITLALGGLMKVIFSLTKCMA